MDVDIRGKKQISESESLSALQKFQKQHQPSSVGGQGGSLSNKSLIPDDKYHMIGAMISELQEFEKSKEATKTDRKRKISEVIEKEEAEMKDSTGKKLKKEKKEKKEKKAKK